MAIRLGVDFGGTKIEAAALAQNGAVAARRRVATPRSYEDAVGAVRDLVGAVAQEAGAGPGAPVGIGVPGSPNPRTGLIRNANSTWLNGQPFGPDLEDALGRRVRLANDANCFALSEATDGAAAGADPVFGVIIGTGCGGGVVCGGALLEGAGGIAGEWGHTPLPWPAAAEHPGPVCWCGRHGCLETWLSGPGMSADHARATGEALAPAEIAARSAAGDSAARATLQRYRSRLARGLAMIVDIVDPEIVVLGGGLSNIAAIHEGLEPQIAAHVFSDDCRVRVVRNTHGDSSGVRGAAWLWREGEA